MTMSCYQLNIFAMQSRINKFNRQLTSISDKRTNVTMQMNQIIKQYQGDYEADIEKNLISVSSPLAKALIGKEVGDVAEYMAPGGKKSFEILEVQYL